MHRIGASLGEERLNEFYIMDRKLIVYIAMSVDGFIAGQNEDLSFLDIADVVGEDYGYYAFYDTIDTVIIGRKTYEKVLSFGIDFPHAKKQCYVVTSKLFEPNNDVIFYNGNVDDLVNQIKAKPGKNIYCDGGAQLVNSLLKLNLVDELIISVIPCILGKGIRLFQADNHLINLTLQKSQSYKSGLVQIHYLKS